MATWARVGAVPHRDPALKGRSFGLAFVLAAASQVLGRPLRSDIAALAEFTSSGGLRSVGNLASKIQAIRAYAPGTSALLVHASQEDDARRAAGSASLEIVPICSIREAFKPAFGFDIKEWFARQGNDRGEREGLIASLFDLALSADSRLPHWESVAHTAAMALKWNALDSSARRRLETAGTIAQRHMANRGSLEIPPPDWLATIPRERRVALVAHVLQQSADTGNPDPDASLAFARNQLGDDFPPRPAALQEFYAPELRAVGALARLFAVTGRIDEAIVLQARLAELFFGLRHYADVSFPLSEALRLAGVTSSRDVFRRCSELRERLAVIGGLDETSAGFVDLAWARAAVRLDEEIDAAERVLRRLVFNARGHVPPHVQWAAARWLVALLRLLSRQREAAEERLAIEVATGGDSPSADATIAGVLCDLDVLLETEDQIDTPRLQELLGTFATLEPGISRLLSASCDTPTQAAWAIARHYPY
jgi:hypothetical protein